MHIMGEKLVQESLRQQGYFLKAIMNRSAVIFFPGTVQHRTMKVEGLSYEDGYQGNALAVIITEGRIEIRYHNQFSSAQVKNIVCELLNDPQLQILKGFQVIYCGENIL